MHIYLKSKKHFYLNILLSLLFLLLIPIPGCSKQSARKLPVYPVDGELLVSGQPATGAVVTFYPLSTGNLNDMVMATVQDNGRYMPSHPDGAVGLAEGQYAVTVVWYDGTEDRFQGRYSDPQKPVESITVRPGINILSPITLP